MTGGLYLPCSFYCSVLLKFCTMSRTESQDSSYFGWSVQGRLLRGVARRESGRSRQSVAPGQVGETPGRAAVVTQSSVHLGAGWRPLGDMGGPAISPLEVAIPPPGGGEAQPHG